MANLLSRKDPPEPFPLFDGASRARFQARARPLVNKDWARVARPLSRAVSEQESLLEELEIEPSLVAVQDLLDRIDRVRQPILATAPHATAPQAEVRDAAGRSSTAPAGEWLCFWPGRSLATGEAEIASRGFFDIRDRPPLGLWLEVMSRRGVAGPGIFELAVVCFVPTAEIDRAHAGRDACATGSLAFLEEISDAHVRQVETFVFPSWRD